MDDYALVLAAESLQPALALSADGLRFRKQLIYEGQFVKHLGMEQEDAFQVQEKDIDNWVSTGQQMLSNGIKIPLPIEHTSDPEANRGYVTGFEKALDSEGRKSVYSYVQFRDLEAAKMANSSDVSIYVPPVVKDSQSNVYYRPIQHVALTTYPVVTGLDDFKAIAASSITTRKDSMTIALANQLGVQLPAGATDATASQAIAQRFAQLGGQTTSQPAQPNLFNPQAQAQAASQVNPNAFQQGQAPATLPMQSAPAQAPAQPTQPMPVAAPVQQPIAASAPQYPVAMQPAALPLQHAQPLAQPMQPQTQTQAGAMAMSQQQLLMGRMMFSQREAAIDGLVQSGRIAPAYANSMKQEWCSQQALQLSMTDMNAQNAFDSVIRGLGQVASPGNMFQEQTGPQMTLPNMDVGSMALSASDMGNPEKNPLLAAVAGDVKQHQSQYGGGAVA